MTSATPPKNLLVGLDGSGRSDEAIRAAVDLAGRFGSRVTLVHAVDLPAPEEIAGNAFEVASIRAEIESNAFERLAESTQRVFDDVGYSEARADDLLEVVIGKPGQMLLERASKTSADVILLGPHERRGFIDFGSTARAVLAKSGSNVWIQPAAYRPARRILVPVDMSQDSLEALAIARRWAVAYGASILVMHSFLAPEFAYAGAGSGYPAPGPTYVVDDVRAASKEHFEKTIENVEWGGVEHELAFADGRPVDTVLEREKDVDLIIMGSHGRTGLSAAVLGNVAYGVMKDANVPVLAVRQTGRRWLL